MIRKYYPEGILFESDMNKEYLNGVDGLYRAMCENATVEARAVICDSEHNLTVDLNGIRGIIPRREGAIGISDGTVRDIAVISRVNKYVSFKITDVYTGKNGEPEALLSRRAAQEECRANYLCNLGSGDIVDARVTHLETFGAFVDIGCGLASLIPIDAISVSRISHPSDRFYVGQDIKAVVRDIDYETGKITLSHKELLGTWSQNAELFSPGDTVAGIIRSVENYGIFVELTPNLAGLAESKEGVKPGQYASVFIKSILPEKMKIKLIIVDCFDSATKPSKPNYFICGENIGCWTYSPKTCDKVIESVF